ncbi:MAG: lipoate--protein ligase family protein [bacterium]
MKKVLYYCSNMTDASCNLALEKFLLQNRREDTVFLIWQNAPCVIIGKNQVASSEVDLAFARKTGIPVFRRHTGGGAVYHDLGNVNFTFIKDYDPDAPPRFSSLVSPIVDFLRQMNLPAVTGSRNDVAVDKHKVCGTAFTIDRCQGVFEKSPAVYAEKPQDLFSAYDSDRPSGHFEKDPLVVFPVETDTPAAPVPCKPRILIHGCLLFDVDLDTLSRALTPPPEKLIRHGIPSVRSRVANLKDFLPHETVESFKAKLSASVLSGSVPEKLRLSSEDFKTIFALAETYQNLA